MGSLDTSSLLSLVVERLGFGGLPFDIPIRDPGLGRRTNGDGVCLTYLCIPMDMA